VRAGESLGFSKAMLDRKQEMETKVAPRSTMARLPSLVPIAPDNGRTVASATTVMDTEDANSEESASHLSDEIDQDHEQDDRSPDPAPASEEPESLDSLELKRPEYGSDNEHDENTDKSTRLEDLSTTDDPSEVGDDTNEKCLTFKYDSPHTSSVISKTGGQLTTQQLRDFKALCVSCGDLNLRLFELFEHAKEAHLVYVCVLCFSHFKFAKELMVHLFRDHKIPGQQFVTAVEFLKSRGHNALLCCVECSITFDMTKLEDVNTFEAHLCKNNNIRCQKCGKLEIAGLISSHEKVCMGKGTGDLNLDEAVGISTAQLRNRDNSCKFCGKRYAPSKIDAHIRSCSNRIASYHAQGLDGTSANHPRENGDANHGFRSQTEPPNLRRERKVPAVFIQRNKLMPELNLPTVKSNGWKGDSVNLEVTLVNNSPSRLNQRPSPTKLLSHIRSLESSQVASQANASRTSPAKTHAVNINNRKRAFASTTTDSSYSPYNDSSDVSVTVVPVIESKQESSDKPSLPNGQLHEGDMDTTELKVSSSETGPKDNHSDKINSSINNLPPPPQNLPMPARGQNSRRRGSNAVSASQRVVQQTFELLPNIGRPRRLPRKLTSDDFMYDSISKRSYQRAQSMTGSFTERSASVQPASRRPRNSISGTASSAQAVSLQPSDEVEQYRRSDARAQYEHMKWLQQEIDRSSKQI
jgi:hypothetical protein